MERVMVGLDHGYENLTENLIKILNYFSPDIVIWEGHIGKMGKDVHDPEHEAIKHYRTNIKNSGLYLIDNPRIERPLLWNLPERKIPYRQLAAAIIEHYRTGRFSDAILSELERGESMFAADGYMAERMKKILRRHISESTLNIGGAMHFVDDRKGRTLYSKIREHDASFLRFYVSFADDL